MSSTSLRTPRPLPAALVGLLLGLLLPLGACTSGGADAPACTPLAETCNGRDDDCDGTVDDGFDAGATCTVGVGACQASGHKVCTSSGAATICDVPAGTPADETCNGLDDDCDGLVDDGLPGCCVPATTRACGAGVGACAAGTETCTAERAWGGCLDGGGQPVRQPGQVAETCNGVDDDCDGEVDEADAGGCTAYSQDQDQDGFGAFTGPTACLCAPRGSFTATDQTDCNDQAADINPGATEACNGLDDDCNGLVDDAIPPGAACTVTVGTCSASGTLTCQGGQLVCNAGPISTTAEVCNGVDDDCNGLVDDGLASEACYTGPAGTAGVGACHGGSRACQVGTFTQCLGEVVPQVEVCNGVDDDCDGLVDEVGPGAACVVGVGACQATGAQVCQAGSFTCSATPLPPGTEVCNGLDDDCDGVVDDVALGACYGGPPVTRGVGICTAGVQVCQPTGVIACFGEVLPRAETCDGRDEDCDGVVDDVPLEPCYDGPAGTLGIGVCAAGVRACEGGSFGACTGQVLPNVEVCNGLDDDCDGVVDQPGAAGCTTFYVDQDGDGWGTGVSVCSCGAQGVFRATKTGDCNDSSAGINPGAAEACNGVDDDCDGLVDENVTQACPLQQGVCAGSFTTCAGGAFPACTAANYGTDYSTVERICDGLDNNCNGFIDENNPPACP